MLHPCTRHRMSKTTPFAADARLSGSTAEPDRSAQVKPPPRRRARAVNGPVPQGSYLISVWRSSVRVGSPPLPCARRNRLGPRLQGPVDRLKLAGGWLSCRIGPGVGVRTAFDDQLSHPAPGGFFNEMKQHDRGADGDREQAGDDQFPYRALQRELELFGSPYPCGV